MEIPAIILMEMKKNTERKKMTKYLNFNWNWS